MQPIVVLLLLADLVSYSLLFCLVRFGSLYNTLLYFVLLYTPDQTEWLALKLYIKINLFQTEFFVWLFWFSLRSDDVFCIWFAFIRLVVHVCTLCVVRLVSTLIELMFISNLNEIVNYVRTNWLTHNTIRIISFDL